MSRPPTAAPRNSTPPGRAYLLLLALILLWGANWPIMKVGLQSITPLWFSVARMVMGAATLFAFVWLTGRLRLPARGDWPVVLSVGLLQMSGSLLLMNVGLLTVEAGRSAILAYTTPLWAVPGAVVFLRERLSRAKLFGLAAGLGGVLVLFNPLGFDWSDPAVLRGNGCLMLAAVLWAIVILHVRAHDWAADPVEVAPFQMLLASVVLLPAALLFDRGAEVRWSAELFIILLYNGPVATAFCFWITIVIARALPASSSSLAFLGVPAAGLAASALALGEPLTPTNLGGLLLIAIGVALVTLSDRRGWRRATAAAPAGACLPRGRSPYLKP